MIGILENVLVSLMLIGGTIGCLASVVANLVYAGKGW